MGQFPKFDEIVNILTAGRSRNVRLVAALQGNDQLEEKYGDKKARTIKKQYDEYYFEGEKLFNNIAPFFNTYDREGPTDIDYLDGLLGWKCFRR